MQTCPLCDETSAANVLSRARWLPHAAVAAINAEHPEWRPSDGACPACLEDALLATLFAQGAEAMHEAVQTIWPLDAEAAFAALPTPLRLHADPRFRGRGVVLAFVDSGFYPHPDLTEPENRIRVWVDATVDPVEVRRFERTGEPPRWPGWDTQGSYHWHGMMTSVAAAGNGRRSHGVYRGLASEAQLVLIKSGREGAGPDDPSILRGLLWLEAHAAELGVRIVNLSLGGDAPPPEQISAIDQSVERLFRQGILVVAASGNDGIRRLTPPASAEHALTVGGIDDHNTMAEDDESLWHSSYGSGTEGGIKPEMVAPSIWVAAPVLPGSAVESEALELFAARHEADSAQVEARIAELKLITPHYQHVDGTSFAAPLVASTAACMLEASGELTPDQLVDILLGTAHPVPGAPRDRQGAGALEAGAAVAAARRWKFDPGAHGETMPRITDDGLEFWLIEERATRVTLHGTWTDWSDEGETLTAVEKGVWRLQRDLLPPGEYEYKFLLDGAVALDDPANPRKRWDGMQGFNSLFHVPTP